MAADPLRGFHPAVRTWFRRALGPPTEAQVGAWAAIARGESTLLCAPTGSGKTLAAFLSAIDRLVRTERPATPPKRRAGEARSGTSVLYVSPLKALAVDVEKNLRVPLAGIDAAAQASGRSLRSPTVAVRTGDTPARERAQLVRRPPDILITTPESLYLLLTSEQRHMLSSVDTVIVDEIHQLAPGKRGAHLFLSLERLERLRGAGRLQRIGLSATQRPLETVAELLGGFDEGGRPRPVTVVDASKKRALSLRVETPPPGDAGANAEDGRSVWPRIHALLVERIRAARTTMIFVNSRRLAERLASALNDLAGEELALAHHGSVAKDTRALIEDRLKRGALPAIVATSSLELGIDMGSVDQVIQIEAPPSIASGIQRIGRASHHVGGVPTGVLVPKHAQDLVACVAAKDAMEAQDVERTTYPRHPLDVLAQQIVAIVAIGLDGPERTEVGSLLTLVRGAASFATLHETSFHGVLDMLAGRYPSDAFAELRPRITWDRTSNVLTPRASAKRLAILNAGTIADRGLYGVYLQGTERDGTTAARKTSRRLGELDEEMVFELREGDVFLLGASSWRTEEITRDQVRVSPAPGEPGRMPFWHGERAGRTFAFGARIGALVEGVADRAPARARAWLAEQHGLEPRGAEELVDFVDRERAAVGVVASHRTLVVERLKDELGDHRICVLSPFGSRVHAPWAMAVLRALRAFRPGDVQAVWTDDGLVFRVPAGDRPPPLALFFPSSADVEAIVRQELVGSSLFAARFREAAGRALLLPRQFAGKRSPLWATRKRAADLLAVALGHPDFPIVLETYRECLQDAFDLPALVGLLEQVESGAVRTRLVDPPAPSPFAAAVLFSFVANFIYQTDAPLAERRAQALAIDHGQLEELLGEREVRRLLDPTVIEAHERHLQHLAHPLMHADAVHDALLALGDLREDEIAQRSGVPERAAAWIDDLVEAGRVVRLRRGDRRMVVAVEDAARYRDALGLRLDQELPAVFRDSAPAPLDTLIARWARTHGPFTAETLVARWDVPAEAVAEVLAERARAGKLRSGAFTEGAEGQVQWVDSDVLQALRQKTLGKLRRSIEPVPAEVFARFLVDFQRVRPFRFETEARAPVDTDRGVADVLAVVEQLEGCPIPVSVLERDVLRARLPDYQPHHLDHLLASGHVVWAGIEPIGARDGRVALYRAEREPLLAPWPDDERRAELGELARAVLALLEQRGASFLEGITRGLGTFPGAVEAALWELVWAGFVTNDTFAPLRELRRPARGETRDRKARSRQRARGLLPAPTPSRGAGGRWSVRRARWDTAPSPTERRMATAEALLDRYGVVLRETAQAEALPWGFSWIYEVFRAMEEQGRVRRGYFVADRGALQFARPGAEDQLRARGDSSDAVVVLAATDPANPYGALLPWPASRGRNPQRAAHAHVILHGGRPLGWLAAGSEHLTTFLPRDEAARSDAATLLARTVTALGRRRAEATIITTIDDSRAPASPFAAALTALGFRERQDALVRLEREHRRGGTGASDADETHDDES